MSETSAGQRSGGGALSLHTVWLAIAAAYAFGVLNFSSLPVDDGDFWWTLAIGREIWIAGALPATDPLAFTLTPEGYHAGQWLANVITYGAYLLGRFELLVVLRAGLIAVVFALLYAGCRRAGAGPAIAGLCTIFALPLINLGLGLRPQIFALVPFVLYLEATRHPPAWQRVAWVLPIAMVFWANVHGSFVLGLALVGLALFGRLVADARRGALRHATRDGELRWLAALLAVSLLAPLLNPYGIGVTAYVRDVLAVAPGRFSAGSLATEWMPTRLDTPGGPAFFASVAALLLVFALARLRSRHSLGQDESAGGRGGDLGTWEPLRLLFFGLFAVRSIRGIVWWGLLLPAPLSSLVQRTIAPGPRRAEAPGNPRANGALLGAALVFSLASLPWWRSVLPGLPDEARSIVEPSPLVGVADWLAANGGTARPFHYIAWGPYLSWRLGPGQRIFVDGRFEAYEPRVFEDYESISNGAPGWDDLLVTYGADCLIVNGSWQPALIRVLEGSPRWRLVHAEGDALIYRSTSVA